MQLVRVRADTAEDELPGRYQNIDLKPVYGDDVNNDVEDAASAFYEAAIHSHFLRAADRKAEIWLVTVLHPLGEPGRWAVFAFPGLGKPHE